MIGDPGPLIDLTIAGLRAGNPTSHRADLDPLRSNPQEQRAAAVTFVGLPLQRGCGLVGSRVAEGGADQLGDPRLILTDHGDIGDHDAPFAIIPSRQLR